MLPDVQSRKSKNPTYRVHRCRRRGPRVRPSQQRQKLHFLLLTTTSSSSTFAVAAPALAPPALTHTSNGDETLTLNHNLASSSSASTGDSAFQLPIEAIVGEWKNVTIS